MPNPMIIFCAPEHQQAIADAHGTRPTHIITLNFADEFHDLRQRIANVQQHPDFQAKLSTQQKNNPEYWSADYTLIDESESTFCCPRLA